MWGAGLATERAAPITQNEQNAGLFFFLYDVDQFFLSFFFFLTFVCVFLAVLGLHCCSVSPPAAVLGLSLRRLLLSHSAGSRAHGLSSCGAQGQLLRGVWGPPESGTEPVSPASAGGFFTTEPPGKPKMLGLCTK